MLKSFQERPLVVGTWLIVALTLWRVVTLFFNGTDLYVDEAQYWFWGQELDWGYYSKPPLIGWIIRASVELAGSDAAPFVRLPAPLFHGLTALIMLWGAGRLLPAMQAALVGLAYATLPAVSLGSALVSTDTFLLPFFALALLTYMQLTQASSRKLALLLGFAIGMGMMAKYAMIYFAVFSAIAAIFLQSYQIAWRDAVLAGLIALLIISPNLIWNALNDFSTLSHTADNANWQGVQFKFDKMGAFLAGQLGVFGPVLFGVFVIIVVRIMRGGQSAQMRFLAIMSAPIIIAMTLQALISRAHANWAATAYIAATLLVIPWLYEKHRKWLVVSFLLHGAIALLLPLMTMIPDRLTIGKRGAFERVMGQAEQTEAIAALARREGLSVIVADYRAIAADLFYRLKGQSFTIYGFSYWGKPGHHFALKHPYPGDQSRDFLYVGLRPETTCRNKAVDPKTAIRELTRWSHASGAYRKKTFIAYRISAACWAK